MKKILYFFLLALFLACGSASTLLKSATTSNWYGVELRPSQVLTNGDNFYTRPLNNKENEYITVFYDTSLYQDGTYYYNQLWASYGWNRNGDILTASQYAVKPNNSTLHISVKRGVAIYIYPDGEFRVFRVLRTKSPFADSID